MDWFKMYTEAGTDPKLDTLTADQHRVWFKLLCKAAKTNGEIAAMRDRILAIEVAGGSVELLQETLGILAELEIVTQDEGGITFSKFAQRQARKPSDAPEEVTRRKRESRERLAMSRDVTPGHAMSRPREEESREEKTRVEKTRPEKNPSLRSGVLEDFKNAVESSEFHEDAAPFHRSIMLELTKAGFTVASEFPVDGRPSGRNGRIDIIAERHGVKVVAEVDRLSPRRGSVEKLLMVRGALKVIILRGADFPVPHGIDLVIGVFPHASFRSTRLQPAPKPREILDPDFEALWRSHVGPRKGLHKTEARALYKAALGAGDTAAEIKEGHERYLASAVWQKDGGRFVEALDVWLRNKRWRDEPVAASVFPQIARTVTQSSPQNVTDDAISGFLEMYKGTGS